MLKIEHINQFSLIVGYFKRIRKSAACFDVNVRRNRFLRFKSHLKLLDAVRFPECSEDVEFRSLTSHLTTVRQLDKDTYLTGGCEQRFYSAAVVDANTLKIIRPVIQQIGSLYNFVTYKGVVLVAINGRVLVLTGLDTPLEHRLSIHDYTLNSSAPGSSGVNCGRNMILDKGKAYLTCKRKQSEALCYLVRLDLGSLDPANLSDSRDRLNLIEIAEVPSKSSLHMGETFIFVVSNGKIMRINKKTLKVSELESPLEESPALRGGLVAVGTDQYAFVAQKNIMYLLRIEKSKVKKVDEINTEKFTTYCTRMLIPGKFKTISFVARLIESGASALAIYAALMDRMFLIGDFSIFQAERGRILGGIYDPNRHQFILALEKDDSVAIKLTY